MGNFNRNSRGGGKGRFNRDFDRNRGGKGRKFGKREMFKAVCSNCGKDCELPFRPTNDKPVYCSECFEKMGGGRRDRNDRQRFNDRRPRNNDRQDNGQVRQFEELNKKLDKIISLLEPKKENQVATSTENEENTKEPVAEAATEKVEKEPEKKEEKKSKKVARKTKKSSSKKSTTKKASKTKK